MGDHFTLIIKYLLMPFLYNMVVKESTIEGKGLYTQEFIPKGKVLWVWGGSTNGNIGGIEPR